MQRLKNRRFGTIDNKIVVLWQRFGPYHYARLHGAAEVLGREGIRVVGLEVAGKDEYEWEEALDRDVTKRTLFGARNYSSLRGREIVSAVRRGLDEVDPSAVAINGWSVPEALAALRWCRDKGRTPILMSETFLPSTWRVKEFIKWKRVRGFGAALVGGDWHREYLGSLGMPARKVFLGYDAVDNEHFSRGADESRADSNGWRRKYHLPERYFFANTRFLERKNVDVLLRAYARYRAGQTPEVACPHLVVSGSGEMEGPWKGLAQDLGVAEGVHWPGFVQYPDLPAYYGMAEAFVHVAKREAWGLVVNEAAAAGLPLVVGRKVGAACELVRHGENGFLVDADDVAGIAEVLKALDTMGHLRRKAMGERSRSIVGGYGPQRFGEGLRDALRAAGRLS